MITALLAAAGVGFASSFHCATMCGPLVSATCSRDLRRDTLQLQYAVARTVGYSLVGGAVGALAAPLTSSYQVPLRIAAAVITAFVIARAGVKMLRPVREQLVTLRTRKPRVAPWALGLVTSLFPCGALLSGLVVASSSGSALAGALSMAAFALASTPGLLLAVIGATSIAKRFAGARRVAGVALLALAALTVAQAATIAQPTRHSCCARKG
jgi:uncharacterized protein